MKRISKIYRELKEFHAKGMEPKTRKPQTKSSTKSQLGDISKRADSFKIVRGKRTTASMRNSAGLKRYGEENKQKVITPKMQRRALASPAAKAKPKSQVTLKKAPWDKKNEAFDFKVNIDGFPEMFMSGNSPSEVKSHLRKLVKQPSMIKGVDRVTAHDKKKHHRDKMKESVDEGIKYTHAAIDKSGKVIGMASKESDAKDMARRNKGRVVKLKKPMSDKKGDMMINRPFAEGLEEGKMKQLHMYMDQGKSAAWIASKMKLDLKTVKALMGEGTMGDMPEEGTPEATQKAKSMTPGQEGVMDFLRNVGNTVMYGRGNKPKQMNVRKKVDTNRGSTSGQQNSLASRINFGGKYDK